MPDEVINQMLSDILTGCCGVDKAAIEDNKKLKDLIPDSKMREHDLLDSIEYVFKIKLSPQVAEWTRHNEFTVGQIKRMITSRVKK